MNADIKSKRKPAELPDEVDVIAENTALKAELANLKAQNATLLERTTQLEAEHAGFERKVACETAKLVSQLGIGQGSLPAISGSTRPDSPEMAEHMKRVNWHQNFRKH